MSSPELRESSARMLKVTGGRWPRNVSIPQAAGEDMFTSRLAREMKIFPYGRNFGVVVSIVLEKDRQDAPRKRQAFARVGTRGARSKWRGRARSLSPLVPACLRLARLAPACRCLPCPRMSEGFPRHRALLMRWWVAPKSPWICSWMTTLWVGSRCSTPTQGRVLLTSFL
jgi:hypothetical protein